MTAVDELVRAALEGRAYVEVEYDRGSPWRYWLRVRPEDPEKVKARVQTNLALAGLATKGLHG